MIDILKKYLANIGVKDYTELTPEEQKTYQEWTDIFEKDIKPEDLQKFLKSNIGNLSEEMKECVKKGQNREALFKASQIDVFNKIIDFVNEPNRQKQAIENHISSLLK